MTIYMVTYDLNTPGQDYDNLYEALKAHTYWCHPVESVWFVSSDLDPSGLYAELKPHTDRNDKLIIMEASSNSTWSKSVNDSARAWLRRHLWQSVDA